MKSFGCCRLKNILNWSRQPDSKSIPNCNIEILVRPRNAGSSMDQDFYSPLPQYLQLSAGLKGKLNRTTCLDGVLTKPEAHQSEGGLLLLYHFNVEMATAQFRFDTPTACGGELH